MRRFVIFAFAVALIGAVAVWTAPTGTEAQDATEERVAALETQVADLATRVAQLEGSEPSDDASTDEKTESQSGEDQGDMVAFKRTGKVGETWSVKILDVIEDPYQIDPSAEWFTQWLDANPPGEGKQRYTVRVRITNNGDVAAEPASELHLGVIGESEFTYEFTDECGQIPGYLAAVPSVQVRPGESIDANYCWVINSQDLSALVMFAEPLFSTDPEERVLFALKK